MPNDFENAGMEPEILSAENIPSPIISSQIISTLKLRSEDTHSMIQSLVPEISIDSSRIEIIESNGVHWAYIGSAFLMHAKNNKHIKNNDEIPEYIKRTVENELTRLNIEKKYEDIAVAGVFAGDGRKAFFRRMRGLPTNNDHAYCLFKQPGESMVSIEDPRCAIKGGKIKLQSVMNDEVCGFAATALFYYCYRALQSLEIDKFSISTASIFRSIHESSALLDIIRKLEQKIDLPDTIDEVKKAFTEKLRRLSCPIAEFLEAEEVIVVSDDASLEGTPLARDSLSEDFIPNGEPAYFDEIPGSVESRGLEEQEVPVLPVVTAVSVEPTKAISPASEVCDEIQTSEKIRCAQPTRAGVFPEVTQARAVKDAEMKVLEEAQKGLFAQESEARINLCAEEMRARTQLDTGKDLSEKRIIIHTNEIKTRAHITTEEIQSLEQIHQALRKEQASIGDAQQKVSRTVLLKPLEEKEEILLQKSVRFNQTHYASNDKKMVEAAKAALSLSDTLQKTRQSFIEGHINKADFQKQYQDAIKDAMPILEKHRGWKPLLLNLLNTFVFIASLSVSYWATKNFFIFKAPTDSAQKAQEVQNHLVRL